MLDELCIPADDQAKLSKAGINNYQTLKANQNLLDCRTVRGVSLAAQRIVSSALVYLQTLGGDNPLSKFTKKGWMNFAVTMGGRSCSQFSANSEGKGTNENKLTVGSKVQQKCSTSDEKDDSDVDAMEVDEHDSDGQKFHNPNEFGHAEGEEDINPNTGHQAANDGKNQNCECSKKRKFAMMQQGFNVGEVGVVDALLNVDNSNDEQNVPYSMWTSMMNDIRSENVTISRKLWQLMAKTAKGSLLASSES